MDVKERGTSWFTAEESRGLTEFGAVVAAGLDELSRELASKAASLSREGVPSSADARSQLDSLLRSWCGRQPEEQEAVERAVAAARNALLASGLTLEDWCELLAVVQAQLTRRLLDTYGSDATRLTTTLLVLQRYVLCTTRLLARGFLSDKESELAAERQQTERARTRFTRLTESGVLGVIICDYQGNILEANDGFLDKFGYSREELASGEVRWLSMTPPEWAALDLIAIEELREHGRTRPWEKEYFHKDGHRVPILVGVATLSDMETIAFVLDTSERKRVEEIRARSVELELQNRRIQEASRLKSEFLANMSHELRTPLNAIIGFAELLRDREVDPASPQFTEFLDDILNSGRHLQRLINDVLDLAKVEAGKIELRPEEVDVERLVHEVCAVLRAVAASKQIRIDTKVAAAAQRATLDPARFKQILYNYLSNALKFTPARGTVTVTAEVEPAGMLRVAVKDTGIGIATADQGRLFVEFQQLEAGATKKHAGTGLGLALTKRLVEAQGGSVGVKSVLGQGSQFFALLPLHTKPSVVPPPDLSLAVGPRAGSSAILVVEDDARERAVLAHALANAGYGVDLAATGAQAIAACAERYFDAITLDLLLPDMTGLDVLHRVRQHGKNRQTPVIVVTVVAEHGIMTGFNIQDYLTKPVDGRDLLTALEHAAVPPSKSGKVLVVDDDPPSQRLMAATLEQLGYQIQCSSSAMEALALVAEERPVAVVLDLLLPEVDGFEFLLRFRQGEAQQEIPVIVWTGKDLTVEDQRRLRAMAQGVVTKSDWSAPSFLSALQTLLSKARPSVSRVAE